MKILYLSPNYKDYEDAFYQFDVMRELDRQHEVSFYGPGFPHYNPNSTIEEVLEGFDCHPSLICLGHGWLRDTPSKPVDRHPNIEPNSTSIPCIGILNKEYTNFEEKVDYFERHDIPLIFSHHHRAAEWSRHYEPDFVFWPFGVNSERFYDYGEQIRYDLSFSGILRNPNPNVPQTDLRRRVQDELFYSIGELKLYQRPRYREFDIFWRAKPTSRLVAMASQLLHRETRLPQEEYVRLYNRSKMSLNTLSPIDLVGTRYYEAMASKSLALCQESDIYAEFDLFVPGEHCVTFADNLSDFRETVAYYSENDAARQQIAERGHELVMNEHTWKHRVQTLTEHADSRVL